MATYYEYKENEDIGKSMIDWAGLTSTISENLIKEKNRRVELKSKIESNHFKQLNELNKYEQGLDPTFNSKMLEYAQNYKSYLLENHKLMKNGIISVNDAKMIKQNASDTFSNMNLAAKTYNENIKVIMDKGGNINDFLATKAAEVFDLKNKKLFINSDGIGSLGGVLKDGSIDPNTLVPMTAVNNMVQDSYEYFDMADTVAKATKNAEVWKIAISSTRSIEDVRNNPEFDKWKTGTIDGILNSPNKIVAAAGNYLGLTPTTDKKLVEAEPDKYFSVEMVNGKAVFDVDSVEERVRDAVSNELEISLGRKETKQYVGETASQVSARMNKADKAKTFGLIEKAIVEGDENSFNALARETGYVEAKIDDKNQLVFIDSKGDSTAEIDLNTTAKGAATQLSAQLGLGAQDYADWSKLQDNTPVNIKVYDFKPYAIKQAAKKIPLELIKDIDKAFGYEPSKSSGGTSMDQMNANKGSSSDNIISKVAMAAQSIGLDPNKVGYEGNNATYNGEAIGSNAASISEKLNQIRNESEVVESNASKKGGNSRN